MNSNDFWKIINETHMKAQGNESVQAELIESTLVEMDNLHLFNFEEILRIKLIESDDYKVMAATRIINGSVTDDSYLYFRCWLIGKGKEIYERVVAEPDELYHHISKDESTDFEELLYVATKEN